MNEAKKKFYRFVVRNLGPCTASEMVLLTIILESIMLAVGEEGLLQYSSLSPPTTHKIFHFSSLNGQ